MPRGDRAALARVRLGLASTETTFRAALARAKARGELASSADVDALARYLTAGFQGLRLVGKVNAKRAELEDIATTMMRCLDPPARRWPPSGPHEPDEDAEETLHGAATGAHTGDPTADLRNAMVRPQSKQSDFTAPDGVSSGRST